MTREEQDHFYATSGFDVHRSTFWDCDHCISVVEGGGECGIENYQTLCQPCHKRKTAQLTRRLAAQRHAGRPLFAPEPMPLQEALPL